MVETVSSVGCRAAKGLAVVIVVGDVADVRAAELGEQGWVSLLDDMVGCEGR